MKNGKTKLASSAKTQNNSEKTNNLQKIIVNK